MEHLIYIRPATEADAPLLARCVLMAFLVDMSHFDRTETDRILDGMTALCRRKDTLYSWKNSTIAMLDDHAAGCIISYDGARYAEMKSLSMPLLLEFMKPVWGNSFDQMTDETCAGEFYLDTMAVLPEFRHNGLATRMLRSQVAAAAEKGIPLCTLLVDPANPRARRLYERIGFKEDGKIFAFSEEYIRMIVEIDA